MSAQESKKKSPEANWLGRLDKLANAGSVKDPVSMYKMENKKNVRRYITSTSAIHTHMHAHTAKQKSNNLSRELTIDNIFWRDQWVAE